MNQLHESNQLHFFSENSDIKPEPEVVSQLLGKLSKFGFMPTFGQSINALSGEKKKFIIMVTGDENLRIEFQANRIVLSSEGINLDELLEKANEILPLLEEVFPEKKANRLSLINNKLYVGNDEEYSALYKKLFTYHQAEPFEWDNRIAERKPLDNTKEQLNCISAIRRCKVSAPFHNSNQPFDAVTSESDINTIPENENFRFSLNESIEILSEILKVSKSASDLLNPYFS